jgi:hypothetical protein
MSGIVELRQYTLKPGQRDVLIDLFEREFVESQEAEGMDIIGTFRGAGDPDRFVWLRGFPDMDARARSLAAFYGGPIWKQHRDAANATMIDSDNVLLLKPASDGAGFPAGGMRARRHPLFRYAGSGGFHHSPPRNDGGAVPGGWRPGHRLFRDRAQPEQLSGFAGARGGECPGMVRDVC